MSEHSEITGIKWKYLFGISIVGLIVFPFLAYAEDPIDEFSFQGILKDKEGNLITAIKDITLKIYTVPTDGSSLWSEDYDNVNVSDGLFSINVGSQTPFSSVIDFTDALYLKAIVKNEDGSIPEILFSRCVLCSFVTY